MTRANLTNLGRLANRRLQLRLTPANPVACCRVATSIQIPLQIPHHLRNPSYRPVTSSFFSTSSHLARPLSPDVLSRVKAAEITDEQYHELSDEYLENLLNKFENAQDERDDMDVEYSSGVMNINIASIGTYVINKQPPNKQIWLSSPISGPKRFDYVVVSDGQHQKEGTATGGWVYLRDGTILSEILSAETGVDPEEPPLSSVNS